MEEQIANALEHDETIDITTTGRKSGLPRRVEIWFRRVDGCTYITGTPRPRDWYANLLDNPAFTFHFKESVVADIPARSIPITDPAERQRILMDPCMSWYHDAVDSIEEFVATGPLVEVLFD